jgi:CoA-transferase family III
MPIPSLPLEGIRVIDVAEHGFVPTAAAVLAEYGADVIKVERLDGDPNRKIIPSGMVQTRDGIDYLAEIFNRNKRDIALDITTDAGQSVLARLIASADVFVTNQLPQVQRKLHTTPDRPRPRPRRANGPPRRDRQHDRLPLLRAGRLRQRRLDRGRRRPPDAGDRRPSGADPSGAEVGGAGHACSWQCGS